MVDLPTRIDSEDALQRGLDLLRDIDPSLISVMNRVPHVPLRIRNSDFCAFCDIVISQLVSKAAAAAISERLSFVCQPMTAAYFLTLEDETLAPVGLSRAKRETLRGVAQAIVSNTLDLDKLCQMPVGEAHEALTCLKGVGPWTADIFLLFCAGHADIFPSGDVALQQAIAEIEGCDRPNARQTAKHAERWSPLRGVAARLLYADYSRRLGRVGVTALPV